MSRPRRRHGLMTDRWGWQAGAWVQNSLPTWLPRQAPAGLLTRPQIREAGLVVGGVEPVAQLVFTTRRREVREPLWDRADLTATHTCPGLVAELHQLPTPTRTEIAHEIEESRHAA